MTLLLLIPVAWIVLLALAVGLCMAASRGEETRDFLETAPSPRGRDAVHGRAYAARGVAYADAAAAIQVRNADERQEHPARAVAAARRAANIIAA
jgi:hypothetical protein